MNSTQNKKIEQVKETIIIVELMLVVKSTISEHLTGETLNLQEIL